MRMNKKNLQLAAMFRSQKQKKARFHLTAWLKMLFDSAGGQVPA